MQTDYHYRHLVWEERPAVGTGKDVWNHLPVRIDEVNESQNASATLNWLRLDTDEPDPPVTILKMKELPTMGMRLY